MTNTPPNRRTPPGRGNWKDGFGRRLSVYLMGIAIGLMVLGLFQRLKAGAQRSQQQQQAAEQPVPAGVPTSGTSNAPAPDADTTPAVGNAESPDGG